MTPNDAPSTIQGNPDSILELMKLPAFQNLLAKVETNFYRNRPKEAAELELEGRFDLPSRNAQPRRGRSSRRRARRAFQWSKPRS